MEDHTSRRMEATAITRDRYKKCPSCGNFSHFSEGVNYCMLCGTKMIDACGECMEPILYPTAKHCPACGTSYKSTRSDGEARGPELKMKVG